MRKIKTNKILKFTSLILIFLTSFLLFPSRAHAQNLTINASLNWVDGASSCYGTINGLDSQYYNAVKGDNITFNLTNVSSQYNMAVSITEAGHSTYSVTIPHNGSTSTTFPVNSEITLTDDSPNPPDDNPCTSNKGGPGWMIILDANGSISCSISNNQVWNVAINYYDVANTVTVYRDGTYVYQFTNNKNSQVTSPLQFAAQSTAATYNIYNGANNSARLLGQATCPAKTVSTSSSTSSSSKPSSTTPAATPTPTASTNKPLAANPTSSNKTSQTIPITTKKTQTIPTWAYPASILAVGGLGFAVWKFGLLSKFF